MPTTSPAAPAPVLVLVPGATGAPADGGAPFHLADATVPQLSVTDLVATRGDGIFETIGAFDGVPVNVGPHLARLARSAGLIELPEPDQAVLAEAVDAAIAAHQPVAELSVRVMLTRGIEGAGTPTCWIHARVSDDWTPYRAGMRVAVLDRGLATTVTGTSPWLLSGAKTLSYAVNMAAVREAKRRGAADVLFLSSDGFVLEGPTSTLLVRRGEEFLTTPVSAGVLPGTSVKSLFTWLQQDGVAVRDELMTPADVAGSDGAWLLSSTRLAAPITHLDDAELPVDHELTARFQTVLKGQA
ncbi:4-amino-4-deoxychorismate lyase [Brachybacterium vulturis]|uniref:4-amino-4-deoxychorismate lyase n=1 Tax=Brachybacterium vulturis TaxID=2017484 RepID=A0A291GJJ9_9MICO|nr:aminotransferase class IV [Brachybacterium vulturis]ATG50226.1 4-amino-4-deoxychorismate lyase [Brachybacterium vulturis]